MIKKLLEDAKKQLCGWNHINLVDSQRTKIVTCITKIDQALAELNKQEMHKEQERTTVEVDSKLVAEAIKLKQRIEKAVVQLKDTPTREYYKAQDDGCDANGSWDCFLEKFTKWKEQIISTLEGKPKCETCGDTGIAEQALGGKE